MSWKLNVYILANEKPQTFERKEDAEAEADQIMFMQPGEVIVTVEEEDE